MNDCHCAKQHFTKENENNVINNEAAQSSAAAACARSQRGFEPPKCSADISEGLFENDLGLFFKSSSRNAEFSVRDDVYCVLENPKNSGVTIFLSEVFLASLSGTTLHARGFITKDTCQIEDCCKKISTETCLFCGRPKGKIYLCKKLSEHSARPTDVCFDVPAYDTHTEYTEGRIALKSGEAFVLKVTPSTSCGGAARGAFAFAWWEIPHKDNDCPCHRE
ncbi:MAG: hypothetical protein PUB42_03840 [Firmicutes bacterium]|nr:hypothetical protein [Bacillota bacterium]